MYKDHVFYRDFLKEYPIIERGEGVYLYDSEGNCYLDACSGSMNVTIGHGVAEVAEAMAEQGRKVAMVWGSFGRTEPLIELAGRVAEMAPGGLDKVWFVSGGSEANESALMLVRQYYISKGESEKYRFIGRWQSFHGSTLACRSMGGKVWQRAGLTPLLLDFHHIVSPYCYRCPLARNYPDCGIACADELERLILQLGPETIAAFMTEPISGSGICGLTPPPEYFPRIKEICDKYDVLLIVDEVMAGFGRTGAKFAIDHWKVVPDVITFDKGVSGGYSPLGGFIVGDKIVDVLKEKNKGKFSHGHAYQGNPLSCAVGVAALNYFKKENLLKRAKERGDYLIGRLQELSTKHVSIGDIRGKGLMVGVEFVKDRDTKEPFPSEAQFAIRLTQMALDKRVILFGMQGCVDTISGDEILIIPPLCISEGEIDEIVIVLDESLTQLEEELL